MLRKISCLVLMATLAGCGHSQDTQFYLLNPLPADQVRAVSIKDQPKIGLGPISFPRYLNQPQIVTRQTNSQLKLNEFHRWAESLDDNTMSVIRQNLTNMMRSAHIANWPWRHSDGVTYQIRLDISRFDADEKGAVVLETRWQILQNADKKPIVTTSRTYREHLSPKFTYNDLANCMSQLLARLSRDIAVSIQNH